MRVLTMCLLIFAAATALCGLTGGTSAAALWLVSTSAKTGKLNAEKVPGLTMRLKDEKTTTEVGCEESAIENNIIEGLINGNDIGKVVKASWNKGEETCQVVGFSVFKVKVTTNVLSEPWLLLAFTHENNEGLIWLLIHTSPVQIINSAMKCSFEVPAGLTDGLWHNSLQWLLFSNTVDSVGELLGHKNTLEIQKVTAGCLGVVENGDKAYFEGVYESVGGNKLTIKLGP
jgi:hypothetical protein